MKELDGPVAILGDAHLREGEDEVAGFVRFVDRLADDVRALVILGDLFAAWVGRAGAAIPAIIVTSVNLSPSLRSSELRICPWSLSHAPRRTRISKSPSLS